MRIAHVSDLHIRNFKYRREYAVAFDRLYGQLADLQPDLIVNTGDTVHSKLAVSPELFDDVADHCVRMSDVAPYWMILGNHDLNLKNPDRSDAISPIVRAIRGRTRHAVELLDDGPGWGTDCPYWWEKAGDAASKDFWHFDIRGRRDPSKFKIDPTRINIGLYHGSVSGCVTDTGFTMEKAESEVSRFSQMDYVLMGDIHKRQSFRDGRVAYPGSLIQQNYGEELVKGFLLWNIRGKDDFDVRFHPLEVPGRFYTVQVPVTLDLKDVDVPKGSRIKVRVDGELTPSRRMELEKALTERFEPLEIITPDTTGDRKALEEIDLDTLVLPREDMMREHLAERGHGKDVIDETVRLWEEMAKGIEQDVARGSTWSLKSVSWDNMMNYGEGNSIDLTKVRGLVGIFAPNASGKSSIFDIILQTFFDKLSKEVPRNIDLINDNRDEGRMEARFESGGQEYKISRLIERISYGQRKLAEVKQWGKTSLDLTRGEESLNGTSRPETEREIRKVVGSFEDFALTTMVSQNPIFGLPGGGDIINCKETDRRKILFRFLDLDVYERVHQLCKDELKEMTRELKTGDPEAIRVKICALDSQIESLSSDLGSSRLDLEVHEAALASVRARLAQAGATDIEKLEREESDLGAKAVRLRASWSKCEREAKEALSNLDSVSERLTTAFERVIVRPAVPLDELTRRMWEIDQRRSTNDRDYVLMSDEITRGQASLRVLAEVPCEGKFPTCRFISDAVSFESRRREIEAALTELSAEQFGLDGEYASLEAYEIQHREAVEGEKRIAELRLAQERADGRLKDAERRCSDSLGAFQEAQAALEDVRKRLADGSSANISSLRGEEATTLSLIGSTRERIDGLLRSLGGLDEKRSSAEQDLRAASNAIQQIRAHECLEEMTGKAGLPYRILTRVLPVINAEIDKILGGITKFSVFFEDDPDAQSVSLFIRYGDYRSRPLSLGSGAEKFIASIAVRAALLNVSSLPKTDVLIIDEGFGKLDPEHLESLQKVFEYLREAFGTVFIVSHVDSMRDIVDHSIEITSQDGYAHVEVS